MAVRLDTHCGVRNVVVNGVTYYADPPRTDLGGFNPPSGWNNPFDDGVVVVISPTVVEFHDSDGHTVRFTTTPSGGVPTPLLCS